MTKLAAVTDTREPIAVPQTCLKTLPLKARYVVFGQNSNNCTTSSKERLVQVGNSRPYVKNTTDFQIHHFTETQSR